MGKSARGADTEQRAARGVRIAQRRGTTHASTHHLSVLSSPSGLTLAWVLRRKGCYPADERRHESIDRAIVRETVTAPARTHTVLELVPHFTSQSIERLSVKLPPP